MQQSAAKGGGKAIDLRSIHPWEFHAFKGDLATSIEWLGGLPELQKYAAAPRALRLNASTAPFAPDQTSVARKTVDPGQLYARLHQCGLPYIEPNQIKSAVKSLGLQIPDGLLRPSTGLYVLRASDEVLGVVEFGAGYVRSMMLSKANVSASGSRFGLSASVPPTDLHDFLYQVSVASSCPASSSSGPFATAPAPSPKK